QPKSLLSIFIEFNSSSQPLLLISAELTQVGKPPFSEAGNSFLYIKSDTLVSNTSNVPEILFLKNPKSNPKFIFLCTSQVKSGFAPLTGITPFSDPMFQPTSFAEK